MTQSAAPPSPPSLPPPLPTVWMSPFPPEPLPAAKPPSATTGSKGGAADGKRVAGVSPMGLWRALSNQFRWKLVLRMAAGEEITATVAMRGSELRMATVRKHLGLLRMYGVVESKPGTDRRAEIFYLPESRRPEPGVLDFGSCRIVLADPPKAR